MKRCAYSLLVASTLVFSSHAGEVPTLSPEALEIIAGDDWTGSLTYLNYGEPARDFTIPAALEVEIVERGLKLSYNYPEEPQQNSVVTARVSEDGTKLMGAPVTKISILETGAREVLTNYPCEDMGRSAACEMAFTFSENEFRVRKMVTYDGETDGFRRNEYIFTR